MQAPTTSAGWRALLEDFSSQARAIAQKIADARESKCPIAVAALSGDPDAREKVTVIDKRVLEMTAEQETIDIATSQARQALEAAEAAEALDAEIATVRRLIDMSRQRDDAIKVAVAAGEKLRQAIASVAGVSNELSRVLGEEEDDQQRSAEGGLSYVWKIDRNRVDGANLGQLGYSNLETEDQIRAAAEHRLARKAALAERSGAA